MRARVVLFFSSYAPLFALLGIRFSDPKLMILCWLLAGLGVLALLVIYLATRTTASNSFTISTTRDAGPEAAAYLSSYLLPFVAVETPSLRDGLMYFFFFVIALALHVRSSLVQINPLLYLAGKRVLAITSNGGFVGYLIANRSIEPGDEIMASRIDIGVLRQR